jgi:flagellar biosynthesis protein FlhB
MADDKTEQPTPKRISDARKKGQVFKSNDMTQAVLFITAASVLSFVGGYFVDSLKGFMIHSLDPKVLAGPFDANELVGRMANTFIKFLLLSAPLLAALAIVAVALNFFQIGGLLFAPQVLSPKFDKLNPVQGFQSLFFKSKTYLELAKNLLKFTVIFWLAYSTFNANLREVVLSSRVGLSETATLVPKLLFGLLFKIGGAFLLLGAVDFMLQKKLYMKGLMMSKEEVKQEYKEDEGDPHIKHQRKHLHQQLLHESMAKNVPKASAVVVNPTHLAIALRYDESRMVAPKVTAKGQLLMAERILSIARQHRVPIVRNVPVAHSLYALEVGAEIPEELYEAVAEILNWVYELAHREES